MAKPTKRKVSGGRVTEKGTRPHETKYEAPTHTNYKDGPSPTWVPVLMFGLLILGMLVIITNYLGWLPTSDGGASNWYLLLGLGFILGGIITATQFR